MALLSSHYLSQWVITLMCVSHCKGLDGRTTPAASLRPTALTFAPSVWPRWGLVHEDVSSLTSRMRRSILRALPGWRVGSSGEALLGRAGTVWSAGSLLLEPSACWPQEADPPKPVSPTAGETRLPLKVGCKGARASAHRERRGGSEKDRLVPCSVDARPLRLCMSKAFSTQTSSRFPTVTAVA